MSRHLVLAAAAVALAACAGAERRPDTYGARKAIAQELVRRGDWARAFPLVSRLQADDPEDPEILALRGVVYREQKLPREAEADLEEALRLRPGYAYAHAQLAILLEAEARGGEALAHHRKAAELEPKNAGFVNNLAFSTFAHGRARDAIPLFHAALRLDPTNARIRNNLGFAYARTGDFARASEQFTLASGPAEAKNNLGYAYQTSSNLAQAFTLYVDALRLDPGLQQARRNLAEVARRLGRPVPADLPPDPRS